VRYLVRHADAGDKLQWSGPDEQRPLSDVGRREADGLVSVLASYPIVRIVSSLAVRCRQTVEPLANQRHLQVSIDAALAVGADVDRAVELLLHPDADAVAWCSHRELIAPLLIRLRERGAPISDQANWPKGSVWVFDVADGSIASAMYLPPVES
jgi:phosphohistidine phosphatase SixA